MNVRDEARAASARLGKGFWISLALVFTGIVSSLVIRETGGSAAAALIVAAVFNLAGALVMDLYGQRDGVVFGSMVLLVGLMMLPLLWVPDKTAWIRENPLTLGAILIIAASMRHLYQQKWPLFVVAGILGGAHLLISFL
jgi:hypothetical protein